MYNTYTKFKSGRETIGGKNYWYRAGGERRYAHYLQFLKEIGEIKDWEYESTTFEFPIRKGTVIYIPDFKVIFTNDSLDESHIWHEYKRGYMTQKSVTQLRRMAKYYPEEKIILVVDKIPSAYSHKTHKLNKFRDKIDKASKYVERVMDTSKINWFRK